MRFRNCCSIKGVVLALALSATSAKLSAEGACLDPTRMYPLCFVE